MCSQDPSVARDENGKNGQRQGNGTKGDSGGYSRDRQRLCFADAKREKSADEIRKDEIGDQRGFLRHLLRKHFHGYLLQRSGKLHLSSCARGRTEQRIDDGYTEFHWSHHPGSGWTDNEYVNWVESKTGRKWAEVYSGPKHHYIQEGVPTELHQTRWCADKAIEFYRYAAALVPAEANVYSFMAGAYEDKGMREKALEYLRRAHQLNPDRF